MATKRSTKKNKKYRILVGFVDLAKGSYDSYAVGQIVEFDSKLAKKYEKFIEPYVEEEVK